MGGHISVPARIDQTQPRFQQLLLLIEHVEGGSGADAELFLSPFISNLGRFDLTFGRGDGLLRGDVGIPGLGNAGGDLTLCIDRLQSRLIALKTCGPHAAAQNAALKQWDRSLRHQP